MGGRGCAGLGTNWKETQLLGDLCKGGCTDWVLVVEPAEKTRNPSPECWDPQRQGQSIHLPINEVNENTSAKLPDC